MQTCLRLFDSHPRWMALVLGLIAATGFPPLALWPIAMAAMAGFAWLVWRSANWRHAGLLGWLFGVTHFTLANNWIATAFTFQSEMPAALGWAAVPLLSIYLALFPAIGCALAKALFRDASLAAFAPMLGAGWIIGEWLRSWVFTGYAWAPLSLMLVGPFSRPGAAMVLPIAGTYALSGILLTVVALVFAAFLMRRWVIGGVTVAVVAAVMVMPVSREKPGSLPFTLVQPNLRQDELNDASQYEAQFTRIAALSRPLAAQPRRLLLWPESAVPDYLEPGYPQRYYDQMTAGADPALARERLAAVGGADTVLLTGAVNLRIGREGGTTTATGAYNSIVAIGERGRIVGRYDKAHLVPYGEYLPMRSFLEPLGLSRLVAGSIDFLAGPGPRTIDLGTWGKVGAQICYEIVFSGEVVDGANRPDYIFNPSNDGWFGSWGPPQHLAQARMRAIEEGLPVLRATTTGISAVIDARGVVGQHIAMGAATRLDGFVPLAHSPTLFSRLGPWLSLLWAALLMIASFIATRLLAR